MLFKSYKYEIRSKNPYLILQWGISKYPPVFLKKELFLNITISYVIELN